MADEVNLSQLEDLVYLRLIDPEAAGMPPESVYGDFATELEWAEWTRPSKELPP